MNQSIFSLRIALGVLHKYARALERDIKLLCSHLDDLWLRNLFNNYVIYFNLYFVHVTLIKMRGLEIYQCSRLLAFHVSFTGDSASSLEKQARLAPVLSDDQAL